MRENESRTREIIAILTVRGYYPLAAMASVKEILSRQPPEILYHYTGQEGLLGIIGKKEIWASHTQYLNDQREFRHAIELVRDELSRMVQRADTQARPFVEEMNRGMHEHDGMESVNVCVCSFSEEGDILSQWRAYGDGVAKFSIGFSGALLRQVSDQMNFWLVPGLYREREQRALVRALLEDVLQENMAVVPQGDVENEDMYLPPGGNLIAYLNCYAPILKHKTFSEEREWRIVTRPLMCSNKRFDYRPGRSMLIPYYRIPLAGLDVEFGVKRIVVGPVPHGDRAVQAVKSLMVKHRLKDAEVLGSDVPFRNW